MRKVILSALSAVMFFGAEAADVKPGSEPISTGNGTFCVYNVHCGPKVSVFNEGDVGLKLIDKTGTPRLFFNVLMGTIEAPADVKDYSYEEALRLMRPADISVSHFAVSNAFKTAHNEWTYEQSGPNPKSWKDIIDELKLQLEKVYKTEEGWTIEPYFKK